MNRKDKGLKQEGMWRKRWTGIKKERVKKVKLMVSRNWPSVAQKVPGGLGSQISMTFGT
jgi:hypothetical protein